MQPPGPTEPGVHPWVSADPTTDPSTGFRVSVPGVVLITAAPRMGKSHAINYMLHENKDKIDCAVLFSETSFDPSNLPCITYYFRHDRFLPEKLEALLALQASIPKERRPIRAVVLDDCVSSRKQWNHPVLFRAVSQTYHNHLFIIVSTQYPQKIPPDYRSCFFQTLVFKLDGKRALAGAYDAYGTAFDSLDAFTEFNQALPPHCFGFLDKFNRDAGWRVFRCPAHIPPFSLCPPVKPRPKAAGASASAQPGPSTGRKRRKSTL